VGQRITSRCDVNYVGVDIVQAMVARNQLSFGNDRVSFLCADLAVEKSQFRCDWGSREPTKSASLTTPEDQSPTVERAKTFFLVCLEVRRLDSMKTPTLFAGMGSANKYPWADPQPANANS